MGKLTREFRQDETENPAPTKLECCFGHDGGCRYDNARREATVCINGRWLCNGHYERGFDRRLRPLEHDHGG